MVSVPQLRLRVAGGGNVDVALWEWLREDPELRGRVTRVPKSSHSGAMGAVTELVVALTSTGTLAAVARTVSVWLTHRHSDIKVTLTLLDGRQFTLTGGRVKAGDVELLLHAIDDDGPAPTQSPRPTVGL